MCVMCDVCGGVYSLSMMHSIYVMYSKYVVPYGEAFYICDVFVVYYFVW